MREIERRSVPSAVELRASKEGTKKLAGYAALYDTISEDLGGFREVLRPGCFDRAIRDGDDVLARGEHSSALLLGRRSSGTLRISTDAQGLAYEVDLPDTQAGRDLATLVARGDVKQSSFAFLVSKGGVRWSNHEGMPLREITEVSELVDVAPVANPAYRETTVSARAVEEARSLSATPASAAEPKTPSDAEKRAHVTERAMLRAEKRERSLEDWWAAVYAALCTLLGDPWGYYEDSYGYRWSIEATFPDRVIIETFEGTRKLYQYPMTFDAAGVPSFGDPIEVEEQYVPVAAADGGVATMSLNEATQALAEAL